MRFALYASILKGVTTMIENFKFWCQRVLPTVFDDTLSYYECLCKLTQKLNETINQSNETAEAMQQLKSYVDNYFSNLNVQTQINNKLDEMAADGTLDKIINQNIFTDLNNKITDMRDTYIDITYLCLYAGMGIIVDFYNGNNHKYMLIDGGTNNNQNYPFYYAPAAAYPKNDAAYTYDSIISRGIRHLDYAIITHFHDDHIGGFGWCVQNKLIDSDTVVYYGGYIDSSKVNNASGEYTEALRYQTEFAELCAANRILPIALTSKTNLKINGTELTFTNCSDDYNYIYTIAPNNPNFFSAIIMFKLGNIYHLVTSDIPPEIQSHITPWCKKVNILQTPHHGSDTVYSADFAKVVNPDIFLNSYGEAFHSVCEKSVWRSVTRELASKAYNTRYSDVTFRHTIYGTNVNNSSPCMLNPPAYTDGYFPAKTYSGGTVEQTLTNMIAYNNNSTLFDFDADSGTFTCKKEGYYIIICQFNATTPATENPHKVWCGIHNNNVIIGMSQVLTPNHIWTTATAAAYLIAGETITFTIENESGNFTLPASPTNRFKIILLT